MGLDVGEVSIVDGPANLVPFIVLKALVEAGSMSKKQSGENTEAVEVEQPKNGESEESIEKILGHVDSIVERVVKAVKPADPKPDAAAPAPNAVTGSDDPDAGVDDKTTEDVEKSALTISDAFSKAGMTEEALAKFEKATGMKRTAMLFGKQPKKSDVKKSDEQDGSNGQPEVDGEALTLKVLADTIHKAAAFTPTRISQLNEALETLKLVLQGVAPGQSPATSTPKVTTHPNPNTTATLTRKSENEGEGLTVFTKAVTDLTDVVKSLGNRLDKVEQARPAGNSTGDDAATSTTVKKSIWNGVL